MENNLMGKVLIVDDEAGILKMLAKKMETLGYDCDKESDGELALSKLKEKSYDLVITDINMPRLAGTEMLEKLRAFDDITPVVMISGIDEVDMVRRTIREGAYDYLVKPLDFEDLQITARRALEYGRLLRNNAEYKKNLEIKVEERTKELSNAIEEIHKTYDTTILALGSALETRDIETQTHGLRVAQYSLLLARNMDINDKGLLTNTERGAYLHDIGKLN